jgi:hypothetical protein
VLVRVDTRVRARARAHTHTHRYEICCREFSPKPNTFKDQVRELLKWFKGATSFDKNAVLEFPPVFESSQRRDMHEVGNKLGLAHHSSGPKHERRLMVCSNLDAIKHIQKRGGVSAVATAGAASVQQGIVRKARLQQRDEPSLDAATSVEELTNALKQRLVHMLEPYHPQGLVLDTLLSEYSNTYEEPMPCDAWLRLTGSRVRPRDLIDLMSDVLVVVAGGGGDKGGGGGRQKKERIVLRTGADVLPEAQTHGVEGLQEPVGLLEGLQAQQRGGSLVQPEAYHHKELAGEDMATGLVAAPKFGVETEDDELAGHGLEDESGGMGVGKGKKSRSTAGSTGRDEAAGGNSGAEGDSGIKAKDLMQYKEYVRQMVMHSGGRGMSATKIQEALGAVVTASQAKRSKSKSAGALSVFGGAKVPKAIDLGTNRKEFLTTACGLTCRDNKYYLEDRDAGGSHGDSSKARTPGKAGVSVDAALITGKGGVAGGIGGGAKGGSGGASKSSGGGCPVGGNLKGRLLSWCDKRQEARPEMQTVKAPGNGNGNGHVNWLCSLSVVVDGLAYKFQGMASKKSAAEEAAADAALAALESQVALPCKGQAGGAGTGCAVPEQRIFGTCRECFTYGQGDIDVGDGLFYCDTCWENFSK